MRLERLERARGYLAHLMGRGGVSARRAVAVALAGAALWGFGASGTGASTASIAAPQDLGVDASPGELILAQGKVGPPRGPVPPRVTPNFNKQSGAAKPPSGGAKTRSTGPRTGLSGRSNVRTPFNKQARPPSAPRRSATVPERDPRSGQYQRNNQPRPQHNLQPRKGWPHKAQATKDPANKLYRSHRDYLKGKLTNRTQQPPKATPPKMGTPKLGKRGVIRSPFNHHSGAAKPPANRGGFRNLTLDHRNVIRDHFNSRR